MSTQPEKKLDVVSRSGRFPTVEKLNAMLGESALPRLLAERKESPGATGQVRLVELEGIDHMKTDDDSVTLSETGALSD